MLHRAGHSGSRAAQLTRRSFPEPDSFVPVAGITPFTTVDMPGHISGVLYMQGCPYRCPYCHNPQYQTRGKGRHTRLELDSFLKERSGFLDGVVFSGGDPLTEPDSVVCTGKQAKGYGYRVGLHTTGFDSDALDHILSELKVDWVGLDLKAAAEDMPLSTGVSNATIGGFMKSLDMLRNSGVPTEIRTTIHAGLARKAPLDRLVTLLKDLHIDHPVWQVEARQGRADAGLRRRVIHYLNERRLTGWIRVR